MRGSVSLFAALLVGALSLPVSAKKGAIDVTLSPERAFVGEPVRLQIILRLSGSLDEVNTPELDGFDVITGQWPPPVPRVFVRGGTYQISLADVYITPTRAGDLSFGPVRIVVDGETIESAPVPFKALPRPDMPESTPASAEAENRYEDPLIGLPNSPTGTVVVHAVPDREEVYAGGMVLVTYWLLVRPEIRFGEIGVEEPEAEGALSRALVEFNQRRFKGKEILWGGIPYAAYRLGRVAFTPFSPGTLEIKPLVFKAVQGGFGPILERTSAALSIPVRALPEGRPEADGTLVGRYTMTAEAAVTEARVGEAFPVTVVLSGVGDLSNYEFPKLGPLVGGRVRPPALKRDETVDREQELISRLEAQYFVVPEKPGELTISFPRLAVLAPNTGAYSLLETAALTIPVTGEGVLTGNALPGMRAARDARGNATPPRPSWVVILASLLLPPALLLGVAFIDTGLRRRRGQKTPYLPARKALAQAAKAPSPQDLYAGLTRALLLAAEAATKKNLAGGTWQEVKQALLAAGVKEEHAHDIHALLEQADQARFARLEGEKETRARALSDAQRLIDALEEVGR